MAELNEAYEVLSNQKRRQAFDQELMVDLAEFDDRFVEWIRAFVRARRQGD